METNTYVSVNALMLMGRNIIMCEGTKYVAYINNINRHTKTITLTVCEKVTEDKYLINFDISIGVEHIDRLCFNLVSIHEKTETIVITLNEHWNKMTNYSNKITSYAGDSQSLLLNMNTYKIKVITGFTKGRYATAWHVIERLPNGDIKATKICWVDNTKKSGKIVSKTVEAEQKAEQITVDHENKKAIFRHINTVNMKPTGIEWSLDGRKMLGEFIII